MLISGSVTRTKKNTSSLLKGMLFHQRFPTTPLLLPPLFLSFPDSSLLPTTKWRGGLGELSVFKVTNHSDLAYL